MPRVFTPKAFANSSPGKRPGVPDALSRIPNSERVRDLSIQIANAFGVDSHSKSLLTPGRCPGLRLANAFGVSATPLLQSLLPEPSLTVGLMPRLSCCLPTAFCRLLTGD